MTSQPSPEAPSLAAPQDDGNDYATSLRQQAEWIENSVNGSVPITQRIDLHDVDINELRDAANEIDRLEAELSRLRARASERTWRPEEVRERCARAAEEFSGTVGSTYGRQNIAAAIRALPLPEPADLTAKLMHEAADSARLRWRVHQLEDALRGCISMFPSDPSPEQYGRLRTILKQANDALVLPEPHSPWRPIGEAPKDGTDVWLSYREGQYGGYPSYALSAVDGEPDGVAVGCYIKTKEVWMLYGGNTVKPRAWQPYYKPAPLPSPPADGGQ